jgi:hypothetical protein
LTLAAVSACTHSPVTTAGNGPVEPDSSAFVVVVKAMLSELARRDAARVPQYRMDPRVITVDPLPLRSDSAVEEVTSATRAAISTAELSARRSALRELGVQPGDAELPGDCAGTMQPYMPQLLHRGCPAAARHVIAVALPRPDPAAALSDGSPSRWRARLLKSYVGPRGFNTEIMDVLLERRENRWRAVGMVIIGYTE